MDCLNVVKWDKRLKKIFLFDSGPAPDISENLRLMLNNCYMNIRSIFKLINAFVRMLIHKTLQINDMNYISVFVHYFFLLIYLICSLFHRVKHRAQCHQYYVNKVKARLQHESALLFKDNRFIMSLKFFVLYSAPYHILG